MHQLRDSLSLTLFIIFCFLFISKPAGDYSTLYRYVSTNTALNYVMDRTPELCLAYHLTIGWQPHT